MSEADLSDEALHPRSKNLDSNLSGKQKSLKQQLRIKYVSNLSSQGHSSGESSNPAENLCQVFSSSLSNINAKQAWKNGAEKLSHTLNNVRTTFGVLSQRIKKSTKKKQHFCNMESSRSPVTPYTRSRAVLGRTPTKLYSPFSIDTPSGKENNSKRSVKSGNHSKNSGVNDIEKYPWRATKLDLDKRSNVLKKTILPNDQFQMQIAN